MESTIMKKKNMNNDRVGIGLSNIKQQLNTFTGTAIQKRQRQKLEKMVKIDYFVCSRLPLNIPSYC